MFYAEGKSRPVNRNKAVCPGIHLHRLTAFLAALILSLTAVCGHAQEALRQSLAGESAAEANKQAQTTLGYYNLLLGPTTWQFNAGLGVEYNDNVHLSSDDAKGDVIFRPNLNTGMHWPITEQNSLDINLGIGYSAYLLNPDLSQFYINPGSGISFDVYVGDFVINLHDRISITEDAYQNPTAGGSGNTELENTIGFNTTWDMNKAVMTLGYDHVNYASLGSGSSSRPDGMSENFFFTAGARLRPEIVTGVEAGGSIVNYDQTTTTSPGAAQWNTGVFGQMQISEYLSARVSGGYTMYMPDAVAGNENIRDQGDFYFQVLLAHNVNKFLDYTLTAGRSIDFQYYGQPYDRYFVRLNPTWKFIRKFSLATPLWWERGTEVYVNAASYDQYGIGVTVGRQLTEKLSGQVYYRFVKETSELASWNYINNIVGLSLSYRF